MGLKRSIQGLRRQVGAAVAGRKELFESLQALATITALAVGGLWTFLLTNQFRETVPKLGIKQSVSSWKLSDGSTLLRVDSTLTNTGRVQIRRVNGKMIVWRLLPETSEQKTEFRKGNILFNCREGTAASVPDCVPEQGLNLPSQSKVEFAIKDLSSLEPGESVSYWRYEHLDADVRTIEVYTRIEKPGAQDDWVFDQTFDLKHDDKRDLDAR